MNKNYNNMLALGLFIVVCGIFMLVYSFSSHMEVKNLSNKIDFDSLENNNRMSTSDKYYKYLFYAETLESKLKKNSNLPFKNTSCVYLDYAQHNIVSMYKLIFNAADFEDERKGVTEEKIKNLEEILGKYTTCRQAAQYKTELENIQKEIAYSEEQYEESQQRIDDLMYEENYPEAEYGEDSEIQPASNSEQKEPLQENTKPVEPGNTY